MTGEQLSMLVAVIVALFAGLFGREFLGRYIMDRQEHAQKLDEAEAAQTQGVLQAVVAVFQDQSGAVLSLLKDALRANHALVENIGRLAIAVEGQGRSSGQQFVDIQASLNRNTGLIEGMSVKIDRANENTDKLIKALSGDIEELERYLDEAHQR